MDTIYYLHKDGGEVHLYSFWEKKRVDLHEELEKILSAQESETVHIYGLTTLTPLIASMLYMMGYTCIKTRRKKDMHVGDARYSMSKSATYYIQVQTRSKVYITFQNIESIIGTEDLSIPGAEVVDLYTRVRAFFFQGLKKQDRILYSISSMSRSLFSRVNPVYSRSFNCLRNCGKKIGGKRINRFLEEYCRPACKGGLMIRTEKGAVYRGEGVALDCNSIYSWVLCNCNLPTTQFISYGKGKPKEDSKYIYYIYRVVVEGMRCISIPCICRDKSLTGTEYITDAKKVALTLTQTDLQLLKENYVYKNLKIISYVCFRSSSLPYRKYIRQLYGKKEHATGHERDIPKLFMNSFTGGFMKKPYYREVELADSGDGKLIIAQRYKSAEEIEKERDSVSGLCYIGAAILSEARAKIIHDIKSIPAWRSRWLYTDTDSIFLCGKDIPFALSTRMGEYKLEHDFAKCIFYGNKQYVLAETNGELCMKLAGVPMLTRQEISEPEEWILSSQHAKYYAAQIKKMREHMHLERVFSQKLPIIHTYIDWESESIALSCTWEKIVDIRKDKKQGLHLPEGWADADKRMDDDARIDKAIALFNRRRYKVESFEDAARILKNIYISN